MKQTLWTPTFYHGHDFSVTLDEAFAEKAIQATGDTIERRLNEIGVKVAKQTGIIWHAPYQMHENTLLVDTVHIGQNGAWLSNSEESLMYAYTQQFNEPLIYRTHNVDTARQAYTLLRLFSTWYQYADAMLCNDRTN